MHELTVTLTVESLFFLDSAAGIFTIVGSREGPGTPRYPGHPAGTPDENHAIPATDAGGPGYAAVLADIDVTMVCHGW